MGIPMARLLSPWLSVKRILAGVPASTVARSALGMAVRPNSGSGDVQPLPGSLSTASARW